MQTMVQHLLDMVDRLIETQVGAQAARKKEDAVFRVSKENVSKEEMVPSKPLEELKIAFPCLKCDSRWRGTSD